MGTDRRMSLNFLSLSSAPLGDDDTPETVFGYLYYKHNSKVKRSYSKYWFSLKGYRMYYYREKVVNANVGSTNAVEKPLDFIDLLQVLEVRESLEAGAPENSFELVTPTRYAVCCEIS